MKVVAITSSPRKKVRMRKPAVFVPVIVMAAAFLFIGCATNGRTSMSTSGTALLIQIGTVIPFGGYNWRILEVQGSKALIITENITEMLPYNVNLTDVTWETCTLREYLNSAFYNSFSAEDKERIAETKINNPDNLWYGTSGGNDTTDKVFLLSLEEIDKYFGDSGDYLNKRRKTPVQDGDRFIFRDDENGIAFSNNSNRIAQFNNQASFWLLRSPGGASSRNALVTPIGSVGVNGYDVVYVGGVRPALWLKLQ